MITFFVQSIKHILQVGTVFPSSPWLARAMAHPVRCSSSPKRVLEIGPGTGAITRTILPSLQDGDELHLVEINPLFCRHIDRRILRRYRPDHPQVRIDLSCDSILSARLSGRFDFVICSLPFRAFSPHQVRLVCDRLLDLVADAGVLTYMEYIGTGVVKSPFIRRPRRRELARIDRICHTFNGHFKTSRDLVLLNAPPTLVIRLAVRDREAEAAHRPREKQIAPAILVACQASRASAH